MWNYLLPYFIERFRVVLYDLVGAGQDSEVHRRVLSYSQRMYLRTLQTFLMPRPKVERYYFERYQTGLNKSKWKSHAINDTVQ